MHVYHIHKAYASGQVSTPFFCGSLTECRDWLDRYKAIDPAIDPDGRETMRRGFVCRCAGNSGMEHADPAALDQARLSGELAALQRQLHDQAAIIERLTARHEGR